jgi:long-chain acyl-CoA synthetase
MARIIQTFFSNAQCTPDKIAIWCEGENMSYGQLARFVCRWSNAMVLKGLARGDHIGVLLPNSIEFVALMLVAADLGLVLVPLNTSLTASGVSRAFEAADVKHVVSTSAILKNLLSPETANFSFVDGLWLTLDDKYPGTAFLEDLLRSAPDDSVHFNYGQEDDSLILTMTSGSTGEPKPIVLTQQTKFNRASAAVELYNITAADKTLAATPLYHSLAERLVLIPLLTGGTSILMTRFSVSEWLRCVAEQSVSFTIAVSSQLRQIAEQLTSVDEIKVASLRCVVSSSALLEPQLKSELLSKLHCDFHECYGTSEIAIASNLDSIDAQKKLKSVGKAAPGVEIKILRENDEIASPHESGEIVCKTPMLFGGYFKRPDLTREAMWKDYFRTGDVGKLDEDGFLYFLGRKKDIIITGGINVYPADIESVISEHPSVLENAAFSFPDDRLGEVVAVAIVPKNPNDFDQRKIRFHCAEYLADFQQPRKYFIVEALPKNSMGKIMKFHLVSQYTGI